MHTSMWLTQYWFAWVDEALASYTRHMAGLCRRLCRPKMAVAVWFLDPSISHQTQECYIDILVNHVGPISIWNNNEVQFNPPSAVLSSNTSPQDIDVNFDLAGAWKSSIRELPCISPYSILTCDSLPSATCRLQFVSMEQYFLAQWPSLVGQPA